MSVCVWVHTVQYRRPNMYFVGLKGLKGQSQGQRNKTRRPYDCGSVCLGVLYRRPNILYDH
jgi:hypothetical protein